MKGPLIDPDRSGKDDTNHTHINHSEKDDLNPLSSAKREEAEREGPLGTVMLDFDQFADRILRTLEELEKETLLKEEFGGLSADLVTLRSQGISSPPLGETL
jgi:hypothetical protein